MASMKITITALAAAFLPAMVSASTSSMIDAGLQGACTGSVCCSPACSTRIGDFHGCGSSATFGGNCQYKYDYPDGTLDANGCDDVQVTLLRDPEGNPVYDLYHKPSKTYDRYQISNCKSPSPGGFCTVTGGGCDVTQILTGAQGS